MGEGVEPPWPVLLRSKSHRLGLTKKSKYKLCSVITYATHGVCDTWGATQWQWCFNNMQLMCTFCLACQGIYMLLYCQ